MHGRPQPDRRAEPGDLLRESARDPPEVDDAGPRRVERPDPLDGRLDLPEIILAEKRHAVDAVRPGPHVKIVEAGQIALVRRDNDLAATLRRDSVLLAVGVQRSASLHAQPRFERARSVVDPRVDNAAVMPRLVCGDPVFLLENEDAEAVVAEQRLAGDREPENARADHHEIR